MKAAQAKGSAPLGVDEMGRCNCPARCYCEHCPPEKLAEAKAGSVELQTRFHASTNVVFSMDFPDDVLRERIESCISVNDEQKARLAAAWASSRTAHGSIVSHNARRRRSQKTLAGDAACCRVVSRLGDLGE